ncbi:MAG: hypothetical protein ACHQIF_14960, partial [Steroidobacterales bacterium]
MSATDPTQPSEQECTLPRLSQATGLTLVARAGLLLAALLAEKSALNLAVDFRLADAAHGLATVLRIAQH